MTQVTAPAKSTPSKTTSTDNRTRDADSFAVASFILGLPGLLVGNIFLGPTAIVLATLALMRGTARKGRAWFGMVLGLADLVVLATLVTLNGTVSWSH
jgi:hypothetical protein